MHFVIHEAFEAPGAYEGWALARNYQLSYSRLYDGDALPSSAEDIDLLIVMGGPQSPATTKEECPHFDVGAEQTLIRACVAAGKAVLGICLGSQLIGEALGARYEHSPEKEIGSFPIVLTKAGRAHPWFETFGDSLVVGHWHNDMPGLTPDARIIAYSEGCPRQIVQYGDLVYGFQCHMELTPDVVDLLIAASPDEFVTPHRFVQQPSVLRSNSYGEMNKALFGFLDFLSTAYIARESSASCS